MQRYERSKSRNERWNGLLIEKCGVLVKAVSSLGMDLGSSFGMVSCCWIWVEVVELLVLLSSVTRTLSFFNVCFSLFFVVDVEFSAAVSEEGPSSSSARPKCTIVDNIFCQLFTLQYLGVLFREQG